MEGKFSSERDKVTDLAQIVVLHLNNCIEFIKSSINTENTLHHVLNALTDDQKRRDGYQGILPQLNLLNKRYTEKQFSIIKTTICNAKDQLSDSQYNDFCTQIRTSTTTIKEEKGDFAFFYQECIKLLDQQPSFIAPPTSWEDCVKQYQILNRQPASALSNLYTNSK
jgi:hypothetical protein